MAKKSSKKQVPAGARSRRGGFPCPNCDFVAKHPMGLGRHRSARHGALSARAKRRGTSGAWVSREQAAVRAGVHYNTIRKWEQTGLLRRSKRPGVRGALVSTDDLTRVLAERAASTTLSASGTVDAAAVVALERKFGQLVAGLETLLAGLKGPATRGGKKAANGRKKAANGRKKAANGRRKAARKKATRKPAARKKATRKPAARKKATRKKATRKRAAKRKPARRG